jgi:hypothetical protein
MMRLKISFPWLGKDEKVCLISRRHKLFLFLRILLSFGAGFAVFGVLTKLAFTTSGLLVGVFILAWLCLIIGLIISAWTALEWTNDFFIITRERVLVQKKMIGFFESRQESPFSAILSTELETSFIGRTLGFGAIILRSYTGNLRFKRLPFANLIYELLENQRSHIDQEARHQDKDHMREALEQRLSNPPGKPVSTLTSTLKQDPISMYQSGSFLDMAAHFFGLRFVKGQTVIYRTHWWVLLGKTILPGLALVAIALLVGAKWLGFVVGISDVLLYTAAIVATILSWGWWLYEYIDWHNDVYIISPDQLVDVSRKPLGSEQRRSAPLRNIQTVEFMRKGIIGLILNFGTVQIQIGNEELTFDNVYDPASIQAEIFNYFKQHNERMKQNEQEKLADWIQAYDQIKEKRIAGSTSRNGDKRE